MTYTMAEGRREVLDQLAGAADRLGGALTLLGEAYEQLDEHAADRLEAELFGPVQAAYGRAKRVYGAFAERSGLEQHAFEPQSAPGSHDVRVVIGRAVDSAGEAEAMLASLQDSMLPVDVGDPELRAGLAEIRNLLGDVRHNARELTRTIGR